MLMLLILINKVLIFTLIFLLYSTLLHQLIPFDYIVNNNLAAFFVLQ